MLRRPHASSASPTPTNPYLRSTSTTIETTLPSHTVRTVAPSCDMSAPLPFARPCWRRTAAPAVTRVEDSLEFERPIAPPGCPLEHRLLHALGAVPTFPPGRTRASYSISGCTGWMSSRWALPLAPRSRGVRSRRPAGTYPHRSIAQPAATIALMVLYTCSLEKAGGWAPGSRRPPLWPGREGPRRCRLSSTRSSRSRAEPWRFWTLPLTRPRPCRGRAPQRPARGPDPRARR